MVILVLWSKVIQYSVQQLTVKLFYVSVSFILGYSNNVTVPVWFLLRNEVFDQKRVLCGQVFNQSV